MGFRGFTGSLRCVTRELFPAGGENTVNETCEECENAEQRDRQDTACC